MYKNFFFVLALILIFQKSLFLAQENDDFQVNDEGDDMKKRKMGEPTKEQLDQLRSISLSCIILSKHKMYSIQNEIADIVSAHEKQSQSLIYKKIMGTILEKCTMNMQPEMANKFLQELQNKEKKFNINEYEFIYFGFNLQSFKDDRDYKLSNIQEHLIKQAEEFEKHVNEQKQQQTQEDQDSEQSETDFEPKIAGFSMKDQPNQIKLLYLGGIIIIFAGIVYFALQALFQGKKQLKTSRKSKKSSKSE